MRLEPSDIDALRPVIDAAVEATLAKINETGQRVGDQLAYSEANAAALLGIGRHQLRDARYRQEIAAVKVGKSWLYTRESLLRFLAGGAA